MAEPNKIVLVTRKTRLDELIMRFNTRSQARFYINQTVQHQAQQKNRLKQPPAGFEVYEQEHERYQQSLADLKRSLQDLGNLQQVDRDFLPNFLFRPDDLVVTLGVDGLVVNTAKYLSGQYLLAVNPDPAHIDGILLPFNVTNARPAAEKAISKTCKTRQVSMAEARLNNGQHLRAFNDLFIGARTHVSARYEISWGGHTEQHSSSGMIVSTGAGATGWLSSMFNMVNGMLSAYHDQAIQLASPKMTWESESLIFVVREPFISKTSQAHLVSGSITTGSPLRIESRMAQGGVIFSDGVEQDYLEFNAGTVATVGLAALKTHLVVPG